MTPAFLFAADQAAHWSYEGEEGPEHWGEISADYHMCRDGRNQSPIDLEGNISADLPELVFDYVSPPNRETLRNAVLIVSITHCSHGHRPGAGAGAVKVLRARHGICQYSGWHDSSQRTGGRR